jgi:hypothetical protein
LSGRFLAQFFLRWGHAWKVAPTSMGPKAAPAQEKTGDHGFGRARGPALPGGGPPKFAPDLRVFRLTTWLAPPTIGPLPDGCRWNLRSSLLEMCGLALNGGCAVPHAGRWTRKVLWEKDLGSLAK